MRGCLKMIVKGWEDVLKMIFVESLHTSALSSCSLSVFAVPPHERLSYAWNDPINTQHSLTHIPSLPLAQPFVSSLLFHPLPSGLYLSKIPPFSHFTHSIRLLVVTDVGCLLELSNRKFPESLGAQNWTRHTRKVERALWFHPFLDKTWH